MIALAAQGQGWRTDTGWVLRPGPDGVHQVLPQAGGVAPTSRVLGAGGVGTMGGNMTVPIAGGRSLPIAVQTVLPALAVGAGIANAVGAVAISLELRDWLLDRQMREINGGISELIAPDKIDRRVWQCSSGISTPPGVGKSTAGGSQACGDIAAWMNATGYGDSQSSGCLYNAVASVINASGTNSGSATIRRTVTPVPYWPNVQCGNPFVVDNPATFTSSIELACPDGGIYPMAGLCPAREEDHRPITREQAQTRIVDGLQSNPPSPAQAPRILEDALKGPQGIPSDGETTVSGPSSIQGDSTVKTGPNGETITGQQVFNITYNTNTVTVTQTWNYSDGSSETKPPEPTECEKNPNLPQCREFGAPPTDKVQKEDKPISYAPFAFPDAGACPSPVTFTAYGTQRAFAFDPLCAVAVDYVRPVLLVIGAALAAWVFIGGLKS